MTVSPELRYGRIMPWVLIVVGLALALYSIGVRSVRETSSIVEVRERPSERSAATKTGEIELARRTTTSKQMSDNLFGTLIAIALAFVAVGAFYSRIRNVTVAGNTIELGGPSEAQAIADVVTERLADELRASGSGQLPVDSAIKLAGRAAQESARVQQQVVQARVEASGAEPVPQTDVLQRAYESRKVRVGASLPREVIEEIAAEALESNGNDRESRA
jgi:hypothetical protein